MIKRKRGLGRGLDALLGSVASVSKSEENSNIETNSKSKQAITSTENKEGQLCHIPIELIQPGVYQPRIDMHAEALEELADSIKAQGVIQPIVIRPISKEDSKDQHYEIIAGERRWRASQMAGLDHIPAVIRDVSDKATVAMALIENIQREDLNPVEEANAIRRLINEFSMTHQSAADAVGRSRAAVSNLLRLLDLSRETKTLLENGDLEMGHARALLALEHKQQLETAKQVISLELSVRDTEKLVKKILSPKKTNVEDKADPDVMLLANSLSEKLGAEVNFKHNSKGKGKLFIHYNSLDELDGILAHIK